ncbi:MAG TPA: MFS transporter [Chryseolinea sp.]
MILYRLAVKIAFFVNGFVFANWVARLPRIQELYHADNGDIGLVLLSSSIGAVSAMPFAGWTIIKNGSRKITIAAALSYCILVPVIPFVPNIFYLAGLFFFIGISTGMLDVAMNAQAVMVEQLYKRPIMTSFHALFSIGMMLGAWCGSLFIDLGYDLGYHLIIVAGVALVAVLWANGNLIEDKPDAALKHEGPLFRLPNQALIGIGIITFCGMLAEGAMSDWSVNYMQNIAKASKTLAPVGLSAFATAMTIGRIFGDRTRALLGDKKIIIAGGMIATLGLALATLIPQPYFSIAGFFLAGLGLSSIVPIAYSIAGNAKSLPPGVGLAMVTTVGYSGFLFGPPIIGFISEGFSLRIAMGVVALLLSLMTILGIRYNSR